jgi:hypothetical protein
MSKTEEQYKENLDVVSKHLDEKQVERDAEREDHEAQIKAATPTPTQREVDLVRLGVKVELADDGSGPDLVSTPPAPVEKVVAPKGTPGSYATRTVVAGGPGPSHPPPLDHPHAEEEEKNADKAKAKKDDDKK